jgi:uncharacterized protein YndB with AHSA1/START domain
MTTSKKAKAPLTRTVETAVVGDQGERIAGISSEAVRKATGRSWNEWLSILDAVGAKDKDHKTIARWLDGEYPTLGGWWIQMITAGYEQSRGMRRPDEKPDGFQVSGSRTVSTTIDRLFAAFESAELRRRWLQDSEVTIRKTTKNKSMRLTWIDGETSVDVNFYSKGDTKSYVSLQHGRLKTEAQADRMKSYWSKTLDRLQRVLEEGM